MQCSGNKWMAIDRLAVVAAGILREEGKDVVFSRESVREQKAILDTRAARKLRK